MAYLGALIATFLTAWIVGACASTPAGAIAEPSPPARDATVAPVRPSTAPSTATAAAGITITESRAEEAPSGAITITMQGHERPRYAPGDISARAGTVVLFLENIPSIPGSNMGIPHNLHLGLVLGEPLASTRTVQAGSTLVVTIENIPPGVYRYWCTERDGPGEPFHFEKGMVGTLTVRA
jgi:plastocyanin